MIVLDEARQIAGMTAALRARFSEVPAEQVHEEVRRAAEALAGARIRVFVPVLVEREARRRLQTLTAAAGGADVGSAVLTAME